MPDKKGHIQAHSGKYTVAGFIAMYPLIFAANLAMPPEMRFSTQAQHNDSMCLSYTLLVEHYEDEKVAAEKQVDGTESEVEQDALRKAVRLFNDAEQKRSEYCD